MLDELRDSLYTTAWFGLMTMVWCGWAQEAPPARLRLALVVGAFLVRNTEPTSSWVGPVMGLTILLYAVVNGAVSLQRLLTAQVA